MPKDKYEGTIGAKATVTIELAGLGTWGTPYTMEQIIDQATESAAGAVRRAFASSDVGSVSIQSIDITAVYAPGKKIRA